MEPRHLVREKALRMSEYPSTPAPGTGKEIVRRSSSLPEKVSYAEHLAQSGLLPSAYRRQPANVLYAIEYGEMLGLAPLAAINGLHIIEGKPTASAGMVSALVREAGHRLRNGYDKKTKTGWCEIVRCDDPEFTYRVEWTLDRAVIAELCTLKNGKPYARNTKSGKPTPWELYPEAMLKARAITECAREACEEALNGVHYTPEELGAEVDESGEPIRVPAERADRPDAAPDGETPPDWDAEIQAAGDDPVKLRDLYQRAGALEPRNTELAAKIKAAGVAAKARTGNQPVDADLVDESEVDAASNAVEAARVVEALDKAADGDAVNALWDDLKALWGVRIVGRDATVGELANLKVAKLKAAATQAGPPEVAKRSELIALLDKLGVAETERMTVLSGLAGRPVNGIHNLQGDARDLVVHELQNLTALDGPAQQRLVEDVLAEGVVINARLSA